MWMVSSLTFAHGGRRFGVKGLGDKLFAQGYDRVGNDDGGGGVRPYFNAMHDHFNDLTGASTADLPGFDLLDEADEMNGFDLDPTYDYLSGNPSGVIYVLERRSSTNAPGIADSNTVYTILSPIGANIVEKLHLESLYLERQPGIVPKPGTATIAAASLVLLLR